MVTRDHAAQASLRRAADERDERRAQKKRRRTQESTQVRAPDPFSHAFPAIVPGDRTRIPATAHVVIPLVVAVGGGGTGNELGAMPAWLSGAGRQRMAAEHAQAAGRGWGRAEDGGHGAGAGAHPRRDRGSDMNSSAWRLCVCVFETTVKQTKTSLVFVERPNFPRGQISLRLDIRLNVLCCLFVSLYTIVCICTRFTCLHALGIS